MPTALSYFLQCVCIEFQSNQPIEQLMRVIPSGNSLYKYQLFLHSEMEAKNAKPFLPRLHNPRAFHIFCISLTWHRSIYHQNMKLPKHEKSFSAEPQPQQIGFSPVICVCTEIRPTHKSLSYQFTHTATKTERTLVYGASHCLKEKK